MIYAIKSVNTKDEYIYFLFSLHKIYCATVPAANTQQWSQQRYLKKSFSFRFPSHLNEQQCKFNYGKRNQNAVHYIVILIWVIKDLINYSVTWGAYCFYAWFQFQFSCIRSLCLLSKLSHNITQNHILYNALSYSHVSCHCVYVAGSYIRYVFVM